MTKAYQAPAGAFLAIRGVDLQVQPGEFIAVVGKSGSGKTTLLNLLAGIDRPSRGEITMAGTRLNSMSVSALVEWRGQTLGLVFQFFQLLPALPIDFARIVPAAERRRKALALLDRVGIVDQSGKLPANLSGGQQQRAAIARSLANDPPILLADEPGQTTPSHNRAAIIGSALSLADRLEQTGGVSVVEIAVPLPDQHPRQGQMNTLLLAILALGALSPLLSAILITILFNRMLTQQIPQIGMTALWGPQTARVTR